MLGFEFKIIEFLQQFRSPFVDQFFLFLNLFDTKIFYLTFIVLIWVGYNYKLGIKIFFILMLSFFANDLLKAIFMLPRPYIIDPQLTIIKLSNYGFPSGAAQSAVLIPLILISYFKGKKWPKIVGVNFFFWISLSRMYLGVHFLSDLIGGWIVGSILFLIYYYIFPIFEKKMQTQKHPAFAFWIYQLALLPLLLVPKTGYIVFSLLGIFLGLYLSKVYKTFLPNPKNFKELFIRTMIALIGVLLIPDLLKMLHQKLSFIDFNIGLFGMYLAALWLSFSSSYLYKLLIKNKTIKTFIQK